MNITCAKFYKDKITSSGPTYMQTPCQIEQLSLVSCLCINTIGFNHWHREWNIQIAKLMIARLMKYKK